MSSQAEITALISLLDDEDEEILERVSDKLISLGRFVLPKLEEAWGSSDLSQAHFDKIEDIIAQIRFKDVYDQLIEWKSDQLHDVMDGALIIAQLFYPDIDKDAFNIMLNQQKQKIWLELNNSYTPIENINIFNQVFYKILGYEGIHSDKVQYEDFCINHVLEVKKGSSIAIGIIYVSLAQSLELPVYGVNLYQNFILAFQKNFIFDYNEDNKDETIFYMSPINGGASFFRKEIDKYLDALTETPKDKYYSPATPLEINIELLNYLSNLFESTYTDNTLRLKQINQLLSLLT